MIFCAFLFSSIVFASCGNSTSSVVNPISNIAFYDSVTEIIMSPSEFGKIENDRTELGLYGNVKSVKQITYKAIENFGEIIKGEKERKSPTTYDYFSVFNSSGYIVLEEIFNSTFMPAKTINNYNERNQIISVDCYNLDGSREGKWITQYDNFGNLISEKSFDPDGSLSYQLTYEYNADRKIIRQFESGSNAFSLHLSNTFKYDSQGNEIESIKHEEDGTQPMKWISKYDSNNNIIDKTCFTNRIYPTSAGDNMISRGEKLNNGEFAFDSRTTYMYDNKCNIIEEKSLSDNGNSNNVLTYSYVFDNQNNWISKTESLNGIPQYILERVLVYF